jgi:Cdc6-like AAA superfamily ATPase
MIEELHKTLLKHAVAKATKQLYPEPANTGDVFEEYHTLIQGSGIPSLTQREVARHLRSLAKEGYITINVISHSKYGRTCTYRPSNERLSR